MKELVLVRHAKSDWANESIKDVDRPLSERGFADAWAEAALAHTNPNRTESAYRRTTFFDQRRETLMPAWAAFVLGESAIGEDTAK